MPDINVVAHGINPETGEYLSPAERKALFKKGRMGSKIDPSAFRSGVASTTKKTFTQLPRTETGGGGNDSGDGGADNAMLVTIMLRIMTRMTIIVLLRMMIPTMMIRITMMVMTMVTLMALMTRMM